MRVADHEVPESVSQRAAVGLNGQGRQLFRLHIGETAEEGVFVANLVVDPNGELIGIERARLGIDNVVRLSRAVGCRIERLKVTLDNRVNPVGGE